jgi:hypothetical protein
MLVNGPESLAESKPVSQPASGGRNTRALPDGQSAPAKSAAPRRRRDRQESPKTSGEQRFFLAGENGKDGVPALGRECPNEAEAIIEAFRAKVNFYRITEFQTRADVGSSGEPILKKEALRKNNPAS